MSHWRQEEPRQKKSLGQVFLTTDWPVQKVIERLQGWGVNRVLEIGPGSGILTQGLIVAGFAVTAVEKDDRFADLLQRREDLTMGPGRLAIVNADIVRYDLGAWLDETDAPSAVVGNIPYNVSTPILMWVLPHLPRVRGVNFLVQWEFAQRLSSEPGSKSYGSLSVFTQLRAKAELDCKVERTCFQPVPKVDSALVALTPIAKRLDPKELGLVENLARMAFTQRRKKLRNAVRSFVGIEREADSPIDLNRRPETLSPEEFVTLARYAFKDKIEAP